MQTIPKRFIFARWATWFFLILSFLLLIYTFYRAELIYQGDQDEKYFKYYIISLTGVLFWGMVLQLEKNSKLNIVTITTSLLIGILLLEVTLNFKDSFKISDTRSGYEVYQDLRNQKIDAVPSIFPALFVKKNGLLGTDPLFPLAGVSKKTTVFCNETGQYATYPSDRFGFNNPDAEWNLPKAEWVLVGDSFTHGACVRPGEDIGGQIRLITKEHTLNLGMSGSSSLLMLATLKEYATSIKPNKMLWLYYEGNDMAELKLESNSKFLRNYLQSGFSQNLISRQIDIDNRLENFIRKAEAELKLKGIHLPNQPPKITERVEAVAATSTAASIGLTHKNGFLHKILMLTKIFRLFHIRTLIGFDRNLIAQNVINRTESMEVHPLFTEVLQKAKNVTTAWGGKLYFIYLPDKNRYLQSTYSHDLFLKRRKVIAVAKNLDLSVIDIHEEVFANHPYPRSLFQTHTRTIGAHYNARGYNAIAKAIILKVRDEKIVN
jgi:hypothetical protein